MQFKASIVGAAAFALSVAAQSSSLLFTKTPNSVQAGEPVQIGYKAANGQPVTILLRRGKSTDLRTVSVLTSSSTGGSYTWTPSESLANGSDYALEIKQGSEINYSGQFPLSGGSASGNKQPSGPKPSAPSYEKPDVTSAPTHRSTEAPAHHGYGASVADCYATKIGDNQIQYPAHCSSLATSARPTSVPSYGKNTTSPYVYPKPSTVHGPASTYAPAPPANTPIRQPPTKPAPSSGGEAPAPAGTSTGAQATSTGGAATFGSSMALIMGAFAAFAFIN